MSKRAVISVHTDPEIAERLDRLAKGRGQTRSSLAAEALTAYLEQEEAWQASVARGLAEADDPNVKGYTTEEMKAELRRRIYAKAKQAS